MSGESPSRLALLVENLLEQVRGGLGEGELAEARVDGGEVGADDLVESVVLHDVSFLRGRYRCPLSCFRWPRSVLLVVFLCTLSFVVTSS